MEELQKSYDCIISIAQKIDKRIGNLYDNRKLLGIPSDEAIEYNLSEYFPKEIEELKKYISKLLIEGTKKQFYWKYCDYQTYTLTYKERLQKFLDSYYPNATETDFVKRELNVYNTGSLYIRTPLGDEDCVLYIDFIDREEIIKIGYSNIRKIEFLEKKLESESKVLPSEEIEIPEYKIETIKEKITILHELGIIEHLKKIPPFNYPNGLTNLLAPLMNEGKTTIQPILGRLMNSTGKESDNPLTDKYLKKTHTKLINMGVDPKHFKNNN